MEKLLWPAPFRDGKLCEARERIRTRAIAGDNSAFALLLALGQLQLALASHNGDITLLVETLDRLGRLAYKFWKGEPDTTIETTFEQAQHWGAEINRLLAEHNLLLRVRIIMPSAGFDMATMLSEHSVTGITTRVREPLSWAIAILGHDDQHRVLVTGKVITE